MRYFDASLKAIAALQRRRIPMTQLTSAAPKVLHVPYTYFPDASGGTEVYVRNLAHFLKKLGYCSSIAAPGTANATYEHGGERVRRFQSDASHKLELAYGAPDEIAAENFRKIVDELRPDIVHLHARTAAVSERLCDIAHEAGAHVVFTYHTPTASCARGTMMLYGKVPCDGTLRRQRCITCALAAHGIPRVLGALSASIPDRMALGLAALGRIVEPVRGVRIPALIGQDHARFHSFMSKVDRVVVLCQWVRDVLARNDVTDEKITVSRHGISNKFGIAAPAAVRDENGPLRLAYFGRIDHAKGPDLLVRSIAAIPNAAVTLDVFPIPQNLALAKQLEGWVACDRRLALRTPVAPDAVQQVMTGYDLIAIPSRWLETGPLVALEAFAAGVPILGADLGGIAESVRNGIDGFLVKPNDVDAWSAAIQSLADNRNRVGELKRNIRPPRTMDDVARDMAELYCNLHRQNLGRSVDYKPLKSFGS